MPAAESFLDTNVLLYLLSSDDDKAGVVEKLLEGQHQISVQVLNEFAAVARRKAGLSWTEIRELLDGIRPSCGVRPLTVDTHERGLDLADRYGYSLFDSMLLAAALEAGCRIFYSEDLQDGQTVDRQLTIRDPFKASRGAA